MDWAVAVGVLTLLVAAGTLIWQMRSRRVHLNLEIDGQRSRFITVEVRRNVTGITESETHTGINILLAASNVSERPTTIRKITARAPAMLEALPENACFVTDVRVRPHRLYNKSMTEEEVTYWGIPDGWSTPHHLLPGGHHEAALTYLLAGDPQPRESKLLVKLTVFDSHGKRYRKAVRLQHN